MASFAVALAALCLLSSVAVIRSSDDNFIVQGCVYCDTCRIGFETPATTYISGAKVKVECKERATGSITYTSEGVG